MTCKDKVGNRIRHRHVSILYKYLSIILTREYPSIILTREYPKYLSIILTRVIVVSRMCL